MVLIVCTFSPLMLVPESPPPTFISITPAIMTLRSGREHFGAFVPSLVRVFVDVGASQTRTIDPL